MSDIPYSWTPSATLETLRARARLVDMVRGFFAERGVLEVDTPVLQGGANLDPGVRPFRVDTHDSTRFLPTSPEHPLKRLVAAGYGAVWTLAPAFRYGERGQRHAPEFRMLEWYRPGWDDRGLMSETITLLAAVSGLGEAHEIVPYREAFRRHARIDPADASEADFERILGEAYAAVAGDRLAALDLLLATMVEPALGRGLFTVVSEYPPHAAAQAALRRSADGSLVAARFEIYRDGVELANGYLELTDAGELSQRLERELARSAPEAKLRRDLRFEAALAAGLPPCAGVAVGFDRLAMLSLGVATMAEVQPFGWTSA
jgi:elongation factor P--(R)-beta-lysine ligase